MDYFNVKTENNKFKVFYCYDFIDKKNIKVERELFSKMCKEGCKNYGRKYSCPPFTPNFEKMTEKYQGIQIVLFLCKLEEVNSTEYNKVRIANAVMKSRIIKLMRSLELKFDREFLSTGSCNLCKPCKLKINLPCAHPAERRYSFEALGVNCEDISKKLFGVSLLWYKDKGAPEYTCVMCGLPCNENESEEIGKEIKALIDENKFDL